MTNKSISINNDAANLALLKEQGLVSMQLEHFRANQESLNQLVELSNAGIIIEVHVYGESSNECSNIINSLSCYLMGAQKYAYYACSDG